MAARHPASQRAPPSQHADSTDARPQPALRPRAHHRPASSASQPPSDAEQDGAPMPTPQLPTHTSSTDQHDQPRATSRQHSQAYSHPNDGPRDSSSDEREPPRRRTRSSRQASSVTQARHASPEAHVHGERARPPELVYEGTLRPHQTRSRRATQRGQGQSTGQGRDGRVEESQSQPGTRRMSTRVVHGGVRAGLRSFEDPNNLAASGTDPFPPQLPSHPPRPMPNENPYVPGPGTAMHQPTLPVYEFNHDLYPAYDVHARRIGLEHVRNESSTAQPGQYYRARTRTYPGPNVSAADYPHVMNVDINVNAPLPPETGGGSQSRIRRSRTSPPHSRSGPVSPEFDNDGNADDDFDIPRRGSPSPIPGHTSSHEDFDAPHDHGDPDPSGEPEVDGPPINSTPYLRKMLGLGPEDEVSLNALADPPQGEKPNYPYPTLIKLAIHGSRNKRLTLQGIYHALEYRFEWYRENSEDTSWKNSIRHNLSLNKCFRRAPRPITEPGKGSFWTVDYSQGTGNKRERKRNKKPTKAQLRKLAEEEEARALAIAEGREDLHSPVSASGSTPQTVPPSDGSRGGVSPIGESGSPTAGCTYTNLPSANTPTVGHGLNDAHIDPALRDQGHVSGEVRTRLGHDLSRRRSSGILPPVQIRQSARIHTQNAYRTTQSRSPSPRASSSSSRAAGNPFGRSIGTGRSAPPSQHTFGHGSLPAAPPAAAPAHQYSWPSPANWERYGDNLHPPPPPPPSTSARKATTSNNALLLSGVQSNRSSSSTYVAGPSNAPPRAEPSSSRLPASNHREGPSNLRRTGRRHVYTDSRGNEYPAVGNSYSSASE